MLYCGDYTSVTVCTVTTVVNGIVVNGCATEMCYSDEWLCYIEMCFRGDWLCY